MRPAVIVAFAAVAGLTCPAGAAFAAVDTPLVNDPPEAADDAATVTAGQTLTVPAPGVLANDTDVDGPQLRAVLDTGPAFGNFTFNDDGGFSYTPPAGASGMHQFTYRATDGSGESALATVRVDVLPAPRAPRDTTRPAVSLLRVAGAPVAGYTGFFAATERGRGVATLFRLVAGMRRGPRCIAPPPREAVPPGRRCARALRARQVLRSIRPGSNSLRIGRLPPGDYRLDVVMADGAGNLSSTARVAFRVRARPRSAARGAPGR